MAEVNLDRLLVGREAIERRVGELAEQISADYSGAAAPISIIVVLKGAVFFAMDLLRQLAIPARIDFVQVSSYHGRFDSVGEVTLQKDITMAIGGTDVLLIEDIVDTGLTASWLIEHLQTHRPRSVRLATLLSKPDRRRMPVTIDYTGFVIPDAFVLGYGLDFEEGYRHLPEVYVASPRTGEPEPHRE
ncbi:MAG TPA: hypoxanthine phosphoribosyltransferase [Chloroflexota bacterium]|nr:hypoxanthine phosphoribosyltransferase [Chloroflexota bacterium]